MKSCARAAAAAAAAALAPAGADLRPRVGDGAALREPASGRRLIAAPRCAAALPRTFGRITGVCACRAPQGCIDAHVRQRANRPPGISEAIPDKLQAYL